MFGKGVDLDVSPNFKMYRAGLCISAFIYSAVLWISSLVAGINQVKTGRMETNWFLDILTSYFIVMLVVVTLVCWIVNIFTGNKNGNYSFIGLGALTANVFCVIFFNAFKSMGMF